MRTLGKLAISGVVVFAVLQAIRPSIPTRPATAEVQAPPEIRHIFEKGCYSCHSDDRRLAWFDEIVPGYWLVQHDVLTARKHLDFSTLGSQPAGVQRASLFEAVNMIQLGAMPLPRFSRFHPESKITAEDLQALKDYLAPWARLAPPASNVPPATAPASITALDKVKPEWNGVAFDPSFKSWKPLSTTDRGDNNTFRFILGNDIAVKAVQSGKISPWPDGARLAKIAWQQELGGDGLVHPGKFVQVELMIKDAQLYKATEGWGWGRWRGMDLKPYGTDAGFVNECTVCHLPVTGNDFVYTLPITEAKLAGQEVVNNHAAELPSALPFQPLGWSALTMFVDRNAHSTSTLYGNDAAVQFMIAHHSGPAGAHGPMFLPAGAVLALVSWQQRDDPHWFGARIPDTPKAVEFVQSAASGNSTEYMSFSGAELQKDHLDAVASGQRSAFILGLTPAMLP
jgi:mono/diheme cytochrome c family protein